MLHALSMSQMPGLALLTPPEAVEYTALLPASIAALTALLVILIDLFHQGDTSRGYQAYFSAIGLGIALVSCWVLWGDTIDQSVFHGMLYLDKFTLMFAVIGLGTGILSMLMSPDYLQSHLMDRGEYYMLVLFSVSGMIIIAGAADLLTFFIGFEVMSIPVYVLAGFLRKDSRSAEASMKYFILGAFSAALMLYGIALIYGVTGTTNLEFIGQFLTELLDDPEAASGAIPMVVFGVLLILSGFAFKIASVPFHVWTPDVYTGSPTPAVGFMATAIKAGAFAAMVRVFFIAFDAELLRGGFFGMGWVDVFLFISAASMVLGNLVAITQDNVKRMLAYSSIAHAGYILVGFVAASARPEYFLFNDSVIFYLVTYAVGTVGAFGVLAWFGRRGEEAVEYDDLDGLGFKYPLIGLFMGIFMFSSAGIPPTGGFVGKLYVFRAAVDVGAQTGEMAFIGLAVLGVLTSVAGVYYYLRVLVHMYMRDQKREVHPLVNSGAKFALTVCAVLTLYLGVLPDRVLTWSQEAIADFQGADGEIQQVIDEGKADLEARLEERED
ncbi:MAG: NADH-quinone oxidoreductase subunit N [Persicimonas sp.]